MIVGSCAIQHVCIYTVYLYIYWGIVIIHDHDRNPDLNQQAQWMEWQGVLKCFEHCSFAII
jgi:hypothetical protein